MDRGCYETGYTWYRRAFSSICRLVLPDFKNNSELEEGIKYALENGACGVSIFGELNDDVLAILAKYRTKPE